VTSLLQTPVAVPSTQSGSFRRAWRIQLISRHQFAGWSFQRHFQTPKGGPTCTTLQTPADASRRQQHTSASRRTRRTRASCLSHPLPSIFLSHRSHAHGTRAADKPHCARVGAAQHQGSSRSCCHITFSIRPVPISPYLPFLYFAHCLDPSSFGPIFSSHPSAGLISSGLVHLPPPHDSSILH
jgi:hypothetical protein